MSIEPILTMLNHLEKLHMSLLRLSNDKTALLKSGDIDGIDQLLKEEQAHLAAIVQMDQKRVHAVKQYLTEQGSPVPAEPTMTQLIELADEPDKEPLAEARERLLHAIHELKRQNELNQQMTYQSLQFVNLSLDMIRPRPETVNYSKNEVQGQSPGAKPKLSSFDSQA
ncbi:flagellar protein FlgN [Sporosarcina sp. PTS2304]|uniref:flagellar protein FlgN n=1 Tax=Sporosarcina sp. PTS2304 TaxID=2283194 RepID=UPI000E0D98D4|nr:flagellar protein FlgN [Sporosarcina sp. PTS2304]AXH98414.1 flagellar protein FlgN [Sporosarcina sp. PTS2304]